MTDGHRLYSMTKKGAEIKRDRYIKEHPRLTEADFLVFPIPEWAYRDWKKNKDDPLWWILHQGSPLDDFSPGRKQLIARLWNIRNAQSVQAL